MAKSKMLYCLALIFTYHLTKLLNIIRLASRFNLFFVMPSNLRDCQARHLPRLDFHFNASLIALNLAKHQLSSCHSFAKSFVFSMASYKRLEFNKYLLSTFIDKLDLDRDLILNHPNLPSVLSYGTLAA